MKAIPKCRIAILSDVHGNLPALEAVIADAQKHQTDLFWNLGDFLGYGPFVNDVVDLLFDKCTAQVIGNYDMKVLKFPENEKIWRKSKQHEKFLAFQFAWKNLSSNNAKQLAALNPQQYEIINNFKFHLTHAGPAKINEVIGPQTPDERLLELSQLSGADVILFGHSHIPLFKAIHGVAFINPGSVGRPEGDDPRASYAIINIFADSFTVEFHRVSYDIERMTRAIHAAGLPNEFSEMFKSGRNLNDVQDCKVDEYIVESDNYTSQIEQVRQFALSCGYEAEHSEQVTKLAQIIFDRLSTTHFLGRRERFLLTCAGILHDIGWLQGQKGHHKATMEMILQDSFLPLTHIQRNIVALVARYHRKALPQEKHPVYNNLSSQDRNTVRILGGILRIADGLDRSHMSCISDIHIKTGTDILEFYCHTNGSALPEMTTSQKKADLLAQTLSKEIRFIRC